MSRDSQRDTKLWKAFQLGDKNAYAAIYELHFDSLYSYGKRFIVDESEVEDAIQDLFITLWQSREKLSVVDNIKYYLFRSLRRDIRRMNEREKTFGKIDYESFLFDHACQLEENAPLLPDEELAQKLATVLKSLPKRQLEAITLRYYENFSFDEIASIMDISEKTVRNTLHNSLTLLRKNSNLFNTLIKLTLLCLWQ